MLANFYTHTHRGVENTQLVMNVLWERKTVHYGYVSSCESLPLYFSFSFSFSASSLVLKNVKPMEMSNSPTDPHVGY